MLVFSKARLVFLAVPKTGSTAYERALAPLASLSINSPPQLKHAPIYRYNRFIRPMLEKFISEKMEILAVVREPVSWLGSWYRYRQRPEILGTENATHAISFDQFARAYSRKKRPGFANVGSQARFLKPTINGICANHLFRYEDQAGLIGFLEQRLDAPIAISAANVSPGPPPKLEETTETLLRRTAADDFRLWESIPSGDAALGRLKSA